LVRLARPACLEQHTMSTRSRCRLPILSMAFSWFGLLAFSRAIPYRMESNALFAAAHRDMALSKAVHSFECPVVVPTLKASSQPLHPEVWDAPDLPKDLSYRSLVISSHRLASCHSRITLLSELLRFIVVDSPFSCPNNSRAIAGTSSRFIAADNFCKSVIIVFLSSSPELYRSHAQKPDHAHDAGSEHPLPRPEPGIID